MTAFCSYLSSTLPAVQSSWVLTQCQSLVRQECMAVRAAWKDTQHSESHLLLWEPGQASEKQDLQLDHKVGGGLNGWGGEDEGKDILGGRSCLGKGDEIGHTYWPGGCRLWRGGVWRRSARACCARPRSLDLILKAGEWGWQRDMGAGGN